jgi:hypothetical protein
MDAANSSDRVESGKYGGTKRDRLEWTGATGSQKLDRHIAGGAHLNDPQLPGMTAQRRSNPARQCQLDILRGDPHSG